MTLPPSSPFASWFQALCLDVPDPDRDIDMDQDVEDELHLTESAAARKLFRESPALREAQRIVDWAEKSHEAESLPTAGRSGECSLASISRVDTLDGSLEPPALYYCNCSVVCLIHQQLRCFGSCIWYVLKGIGAVPASAPRSMSCVSVRFDP